MGRRCHGGKHNFDDVQKMAPHGMGSQYSVYVERGRNPITSAWVDVLQGDMSKFEV